MSRDSSLLTQTLISTRLENTWPRSRSPVAAAMAPEVSASYRSANVFTGSWPRAAPLFKPRRFIQGGATIRRQRWSVSSQRWWMPRENYPDTSEAQFTREFARAERRWNVVGPTQVATGERQG